MNRTLSEHLSDQKAYTWPRRKIVNFARIWGVPCEVYNFSVTSSVSILSNKHNKELDVELRQGRQSDLTWALNFWNLLSQVSGKPEIFILTFRCTRQVSGQGWPDCYIQVAGEFRRDKKLIESGWHRNIFHVI